MSEYGTDTSNESKTPPDDDADKTTGAEDKGEGTDTSTGSAGDEQ